MIRQVSSGVMNLTDSKLHANGITKLSPLANGKVETIEESPFDQNQT
jgi:hypothetical protein